MVAEDWGWYLQVRDDRFRLALCCGHQNGDDDEFLCFTDPSTPVVKTLFKKIDATPQLTHLTEALQQILASDPEIREVSIDRVTMISPHHALPRARPLRSGCNRTLSLVGSLRLGRQALPCADLPLLQAACHDPPPQVHPQPGFCGCLRLMREKGGRTVVGDRRCSACCAGHRRCR